MNNGSRSFRIHAAITATLAIIILALCTSDARAHCGTVQVNLHGINCRIHVCAITPNGRYCDTVFNGTTYIPVVGGLQVSGVVIATQNGPVTIAQGTCVDNIRVAPGCCVKVCVLTDGITGCTIVNITPASNPC